MSIDTRIRRNGFWPFGYTWAEQKVESITLLPGYNKKGEKEGYEELVIKAGEIVAIVGPTGSGKSRLLADIEWGAQGDTQQKEQFSLIWRIDGCKKIFSKL